MNDNIHGVEIQDDITPEYTDEALEVHINKLLSEIREMTDSDREIDFNVAVKDACGLISALQDQMLIDVFLRKLKGVAKGYTIGRLRKCVADYKASDNSVSTDRNRALPILPALSPDNKPMIWDIKEVEEYPAKQQGYLVNEVVEAIMAEQDAQNPIICARGKRLVEIETEPKPSISAISKTRLSVILGDMFDWGTINRFNMSPMPLRSVPERVVEGLSESSRKRELPQVNGTICRPIFSTDGEIFKNKGLNAEYGVYIADNYNDISVMDCTATEAWERLKAPFSHFPWSDKKSEACAFGLLFTMLLRETIDDLVPFYLISSAQAGTGKGLLIDALHTITHGYTPVRRSFTRHEESFERKINSAVRTGDACILVDNIKDGWKIASPMLEVLATSRHVSIKVLYETNEESIPFNGILCMTGNNVELTDGLIRRTQICRLVADTQNPAQRDLPDLLGYIKEHRNELLSAAYTILDEWHRRGRPKASQNFRYGSYQTWTDIIGGILEVAGVEGFDPMPTSQTMTDEQMAYWNFVRAVWDVHGEEEWKTKDVLSIAYEPEESEDDDGILQDIIGSRSGLSAVTNRLGQILGKLKDQTFEYEDIAKLQLKRVTGKSPAVWFLQNSGTDDDIPF